MLHRIKLSYFLLQLFIMILLLFSPFLVHAQTITTVQYNELMLTLTTHGQEVKTNFDFYKAGLDCYQHQLKKITYLDRTPFIYLYFNDSLGNCILSRIYLKIIPNQTPGASFCMISDSINTLMAKPWFQDAMKQFDQTKVPNSVVNHGLSIAKQCMMQNITSITAVISMLQSSTQATAHKK